MKNAGAAMKQIHNGLTIDKVDATMDELREQHALGEEIASAITNAPIGEPIDEADLEEELEGLEQEAMDERMLKTGTVPVTGEVNRLPAVGNGPGMSPASPLIFLGPFFPPQTCFFPRCSHPVLPSKTLLTPFNSQCTIHKKKTKRKSYGSSRPKWPCDTQMQLSIRYSF